MLSLDSGHDNSPNCCCGTLATLPILHQYRSKIFLQDFFKEISSFHSIGEGLHFLLGPLSHEREPPSKIDFLLAPQRLFKNNCFRRFAWVISYSDFLLCVYIVNSRLTHFSTFRLNFRCVIFIPQYEVGWLFWDYLSNIEQYYGSWTLFLAHSYFQLGLWPLPYEFIIPSIT